MAQNEILLYADPHIHSHKRSADRLQDCIDALVWVFDSAIERGIGSVVCCGDMFHDRTKIDILTLCRVYEVFERYFGKRKPFDLYLLIGNHDMWHRDRWDVCSPAFLQAFDGVHVVDKPCSLDIQGHFVDFLPYTEDPTSHVPLVRSLQPRSGDRRLLCSHLAMHGAKLNRFTEADVIVEHDGDMVKIDQEFLGGWDQIYLGHYHGEQILGDRDEIEYIGSPLELTKSEAGQRKHIIVHDLDNFQKKYLINDFSPKHLIIKPDQFKDQDLARHFVTLVVPEDSSHAELIDIKHAILKSHGVGSLEIQHERRRRDDSQDRAAVENARAILDSQDNMLER